MLLVGKPRLVDIKRPLPTSRVVQLVLLQSRMEFRSDWYNAHIGIKRPCFLKAGAEKSPGGNDMLKMMPDTANAVQLEKARETEAERATTTTAELGCQNGSTLQKEVSCTLQAARWGTLK